MADDVDKSVSEQESSNENSEFRIFVFCEVASNEHKERITCDPPAASAAKTESTAQRDKGFFKRLKNLVPTA